MRTRIPPNTLPPTMDAPTPQHGWRGLLLDCARHSWSASRLRAVLEEVAAARGNRLHLHLTDDQGWSLPGLRGLDSPLSDPELAALVAHGRGLGVEILPEVDLPGHCGALLEKRPELACPGRGGPRPTAWGCHRAVLCMASPALPAFVDELLDVLAARFPLGIVHLGGDELPAGAWDDCPHCRELARREGLASPDRLASWWLRFLEPRLKARGLRGAFWDEAREAGAPADSLLFAWRGDDAVRFCLRDGYDTVACPMRPCYLDHYPGPEAGQPRAIGGLNTDQACAAFDPGAVVPADAPGRLLGGQGNLWTEYVPDEAVLQERLQPRLALLLEALWAGPRTDPAGLLPGILDGCRTRGWAARLPAPVVERPPIGLPGETIRIQARLPEGAPADAWLELFDAQTGWRPLGVAEELPEHARRTGRLELRVARPGQAGRSLVLEAGPREPWPASPAGADGPGIWQPLGAREPDWRLAGRLPDMPAEALTLAECRWPGPDTAIPEPQSPWSDGPATPSLPALSPWGAVRGWSWTGSLRQEADGLRRLAVVSHSLARIWVDGRLVLDHDAFSPADRREVWLPLAAGRHALRVDWLDLRGGPCRVEGVDA